MKQQPFGDPTLRIHAIESLAKSVLSPVLAQFQQHHPGVVFNVDIVGSDEITSAVRDMATDIGLGYFSQPSPGIEIRAIMREPLVAMVAGHHPLANEPIISLDMTSGFPLALTNRNSGSRDLVDTAFWQAGLRFTPVIETNSVELLTSFVQHGAGITFLLRSSALDGLASGRLKAIPTQSDILNVGSVEALTRASRRLPQIGEDFIGLLTVHMKSIYSPDA